MDKGSAKEECLQMDKESPQAEPLHHVLPPPYTSNPEGGTAYPQQAPPVGFVSYNNANEPVPTVTVMAPLQLDSKSQMVTCSKCGVRSMTKTKAKPNTMTHTMALILFCCICWPCAWMPYACDSCQTIHHYCSNCDTYLGEHRN